MRIRRWILGVLGAMVGIRAQPTVEWATYLGSTAQDEIRSTAIAVDGSLIVVGWTWGVNFPVLNAWQGTKAGGEDAVIAKFSPTNSLLWATYFGGSDNDRALGVGVDREGNLYVVGVTASSDFPVAGAFQSTKRGGTDAFIAKFSSDGQRLWATYYGGGGDDVATAIAVDNQGFIAVTGYTSSTDFPITSNAVQPMLAGYTDAFLVQLRPDGARVWATYLGGTAPDYAYGVGVDSRRTLYICGETTSPNFPVRNAMQRTSKGGIEAFVASFTAFGNLNWSTYYGGSDNDRAYGIAVTVDRHIVVVGTTASGNIRVSPVWQPYHAGGASDAFIVQLTAAGEFRWATFFGGSEADGAISCTADPVGNLYVVGKTSSGDFPILGTGQSLSGGEDKFVLKLHRTGMPQWSLLYGGTGTDQPFAAAVDSAGNVAVVGVTGSTDFPVTANAFQPTLAGLNDGAILRLGGYLLSIELEALPDSVLCTGDVLQLRWNVRGGEFAVDNTFIIELSDAGASFRTPQQLDSLQARSDTSFQVFIPFLPPGGQYRVRIAATKPIAYSNDNGMPVPAQQRPLEPQLAVDGETEFCEGRRALLYVINPQPGVHYRWWRDSTVVAGDATMYAAMESGKYTVEAYNECGSLRARQSFSITVRPLPRRPLLTPSGEIRLCEGDTVELRISGEAGVRYVWFRNDTALPWARDTIVRVWQAGTYTVEARNDCGTVRSQNSAQVHLFPRPPKPMIGRRGDTLVSSALTGNQWLDENRQPIPGATGREFVPPRDGTYYVQVTIGGCSSVSDPYVFVRSAVREIRSAPRISIELSPEREEIRGVVEGESGELLIEVVNLLGSSLFAQRVWNPGYFVFKIPVVAWARGAYFLRIRTPARYFCYWFIKR